MCLGFGVFGCRVFRFRVFGVSRVQGVLGLVCPGFGTFRVFRV